MSPITGMVFNILRYTLDDGPGIRSTVFMKGCPLKCAWCSNPESQNTWPEITHRDSFCQKCLQCVGVCEEKAISVDKNGVYIDRNLCTRCGKCVDVCVTGTLQFMGEEKSVEEVFRLVWKDIEYYKNSGGGVTISGGEALFQADFVEALLKMCRDANIHTCLDTSGYGDPNKLKRILNYTNLVYYDLKLIDPVAHQKFTGKSNDIILSNLKIVNKSDVPVVIRIPVISNVNDSDEEINGFAKLASGIDKIDKVHLLPYHKFGMAKYKILDRSYEYTALEAPSAERLQRLKEIVESYKINCEVRT